MKILIILLSLAISLNAEDKLIHGNVYGVDEDGKKIALSGVRVQWLNSNIGGMSNSNGHFMFDKVEGKNHLVFQMVGYKTDTLHVEDLNKFINHDLSPISTNEVVVERKSPNKFTIVVWKQKKLLLEKHYLILLVVIYRKHLNLTPVYLCNTQTQYLVQSVLD